VLGALAIIIAIMIVLNAQDKKDKELPRQTVTTTTVLPAPSQSPGARPAPDWTDVGPIVNGEDEAGPSRTTLAALEQKLP
jgi:serine/threonine-protein kinase